jgi:hypothetical protein
MNNYRKSECPIFKEGAPQHTWSGLVLMPGSLPFLLSSKHGAWLHCDFGPHPPFLTGLTRPELAGLSDLMCSLEMKTEYPSRLKFIFRKSLGGRKVIRTEAQDP